MLDVVFWIILIASMALAFRHGLIRECLTIISLVLGILLAAYFYSTMIPFGRMVTDRPALQKVFAFLLIFFIVLTTGSLVIYVLNRLMKISHTRWIDRLLGALFGFIRGWLICTVLAIALVTFGIFNTAVGNARLSPYLLETGQVIVHIFPENLKNAFRARFQSMYRQWVQELPSHRMESDTRSKDPSKAIGTKH